MIAAMIGNPFYAVNIDPDLAVAHGPIISEEEWVAANRGCRPVRRHWVVAVTDITPTVHRVRDLLRGGDEQAAAAYLPVEHVYPLPAQIAAGLNASPDVTVGEVPERQHRQ